MDNNAVTPEMWSLIVQRQIMVTRRFAAVVRARTPTRNGDITHFHYRLEVWGAQLVASHERDAGVITSEPPRDRFSAG